MVVYKRKRITRRSPIKRRRYNMSGKTRSRSMGGRVMSFKRTFCIGNVVPSTAATTSFWNYNQVTFATMPSNTEFVALFDQYKINGFKTTWRPRYDNFAGNDTVDTTLPGTTAQGLTNVHIINDPMSSINPTGTYSYTTLNTFLENGSVKSYTGTKPFSVYVKPTIENSLATGVTRIKAPWIDTKNATVPHFGYHSFMNENNMTGVFNQTFDLFVTLYFQCRGSR